MAPFCRSRLSPSAARGRRNGRAGQHLDVVESVLQIPQALARDQQVDVVVAVQRARPARSHDLVVAPDRHDDRRARQLGVAHERPGPDAEVARAARRARNAASRAWRCRSRPGGAQDARRRGRADSPPSASSGPAPRPRGRRRRRRRRRRAARPARRRRSGNVASTIGTPPRSPAQARKPCSRSESPNGVVHSTTASGRARRTSATATKIGASPSSSMREGVTSSPSSTNRPSCASHAEPCRKPRTTAACGMRASPITRPMRYAASRPEPSSAETPTAPASATRP